MPTYIALFNWTPQGMHQLQQSPSRLEAARKDFSAFGVTMKQFFLLMGQHDMLAILEAPDDAAVAKAILSGTARGNITSQTFRAFTEDEYRQILSGLA